jgi:hypothetical protein
MSKSNDDNNGQTSAPVLSRLARYGKEAGMLDDMERIRSATDKQLAFLKRHGVPIDRPLSRGAAQLLIAEYIGERRELPSTPQQQFLRDRGQWRDGLSRGEAFDRIAAIKGRADP